jgi:hypothetical protein
VLPELSDCTLPRNVTLAPSKRRRILFLNDGPASSSAAAAARIPQGADDPSGATARRHSGVPPAT